MDGRARISAEAEAQEQLALVERIASRVFSLIILTIVAYASSPFFNPGMGGKDSGSLFLAALKIGSFTVALLGGLALSGAATGGFLGFLFGIPKSLQGRTADRKILPAALGMDASREALGHLPAGPFAGNTNLEEISDWLTKILVGLGLTQYAAFQLNITEVIKKFASSALADAPGSIGITSLILISSFVCGFLFFYLETRTRIAVLLDRADQWTRARTPEQILTKESQADSAAKLTSLTPASMQSPEKPDEASLEEDREIAKVPFTALNTTERLVTWGVAQARVGNLPSAEKALRAAVKTHPEDVNIGLALAGVQLRAGNKVGANVTVERALAKSPDSRVYKNKILTSLYLPNPDGFQEALKAVDELVRLSPTWLNDPEVQLWIASANGQKYRYFKKMGDESEMKNAKAAALEAVRLVVELAPDSGSLVRTIMRQIFDPAAENSNPDENDLEVFKGMLEFKDLIQRR